MKRAILGALPLLAMLAVVACAPATVAEKKIVDFNYKGTLSDGSVFGESEPGKPLEFQVGSGKIISALEKGMLGMKVGEKKTITVKAADAYGEYDSSALQDVPRAQFPKDLALQVGQHFQVQTAAGVMTVTIAAVKDKTVTVDFNHPLAGKDLTFAVEIVKIREMTSEEKKAAQAVTAPATAPATTQTGTPQPASK